MLKIRTEQDPERKDRPGEWLAHCDALQITTQGDSEAQARENIADAIQAFFESCQERGTLTEALRELGLQLEDVQDEVRSAGEAKHHVCMEKEGHARPVLLPKAESIHPKVLEQCARNAGLGSYALLQEEDEEEGDPS